MELYISGVQVPKLGSWLDTLSRAHLVQKQDKEAALASILAQVAVALAPEKLTSINSAWKRFLNHSFFLESREENKELEMRKELDEVKEMKISISKDKSGKLVLSGLKDL